jgi:hypothetical protein
MNRLNAVLESLKLVITSHPYLTGIAAVFGLAVLLLRKMHYRFVVFPGTLKDS